MSGFERKPPEKLKPHRTISSLLSPSDHQLGHLEFVLR